MNILQVFSANIFTGAVAHALAISDIFVAQGHKVILICDDLPFKTLAQRIDLPVSKRSYPQRLANIKAIRRLIKTHEIDVVHAHSRAASWLCYFAVLGSKTPYISTMHGRMHLHASVKMLDIFGDKVIAVSPNLYTHLVEEGKMKPEKIETIGNGIDFSKIKTQQIPTVGRQTIAIIGRVNGGRSPILTGLLTNVFMRLFEQLPYLYLVIVGGTYQDLQPDTQKAYNNLNNKFGNRMHLAGFVSDVSEWIGRCDAVIAAGRVAIETLYLEKPLFGLGEENYEGLVDTYNFEQAAASNFGDMPIFKNSGIINYHTISQNILSFFNQKPTINSLKQEVKARYDLANLADRLMIIYQSCRMKKYIGHHIPVLMYHKIPLLPINSPHKIFITKENFEKHLRFLKKNNFVPITFLDYQAYADGSRPLKDFPVKPIILTFDDGYEDNFTNLLPLMQVYGYKGVIYCLGNPKITHNEWDTKSGDVPAKLMSLEQQKAFVAQGWEIGGHSLYHYDLAVLDDQQAFVQISESKYNLEKKLEIKIISFAYPYGRYNAQTKDMAQKAGFLYAVATDTGGLRLENDRFAIFRANIFPNDKYFQLAKKTSSWYRKYYKIRKRK